MNIQRMRYREQRHSAGQRGIKFLMTFGEWLEIWQASGHLSQRGKSPGQYVMARHGDVGPYAFDNVKIITMKENIQEGRRGFGNSGRNGKPHDAETRRKISAATMGRAPTIGMTGRRLSEETRRKISEAKRGLS